MDRAEENEHLRRKELTNRKQSLENQENLQTQTPKAERERSFKIIGTIMLNFFFYLYLREREKEREWA